MKWRDHVRITAEVCRHFGLENCREIAQASVLPDKDPDYYWVLRRRRIYRKRVPHHERLAIEYAFKHLKKARRLFLMNKPFHEALGRALHYLQDYSIDPTEKLWIFSYRSDSAHEERENLEIPVDFNAVKKALETKCYPHEFKSTVLKNKRGKNANEIAFTSSFLTALALKMVLKPERPENLEENFRKAKLIHAIILLLPWILLLPFLQGVGYLFFSIIASGILHLLDYNYHCWKLEHDWFFLTG